MKTLKPTATNKTLCWLIVKYDQNEQELTDVAFIRLFS